MNVAIPMFGTRVSPRFDGAPSVLLVTVSDGATQRRTLESMEHVYGGERIGLLSRRGVDVLLCGGIRRCDYFSILNAGIEIYPGLMGEAEDVLAAFLSGSLPKDGFPGSLMPLGPRRQRQRSSRCRRAGGQIGQGSRRALRR